MATDVVIQQGADLMLFGMGIVFVFLTMLVIVTTLMSRLVQRWFPEKELAAATNKESDSGVDDRVVAIIQAALDKHRSRK